MVNTLWGGASCAAYAVEQCSSNILSQVVALNPHLLPFRITVFCIVSGWFIYSGLSLGFRANASRGVSREDLGAKLQKLEVSWDWSISN